MQDLIISGEILKGIHLSPSELMLELAVFLYDKEKLSMGQAKKMAGLTQIEFQKQMAIRGVSIKYGVEDFENDLKTLDFLN